MPNEIIKTTINGNNVEYNSAEFELLEEGNVGLKEYAGFQYLHYVGDGGILLNHKGNISIYKMFSNFAPTQELNLSQFDTSGIVTMRGMLFDCDASLMIKGICYLNGVKIGIVSIFSLVYFI